MDEPTQNRVGWRTTSANRRSILDRLEEEIRQGTIDMPAEEFYQEARDFQLIDGKPQAITGRHDDEIMAAAIAVQLHTKGGAIRGLKRVPESEIKVDYVTPRAQKFTGPRAVKTIGWF